MLPPPSVTPFGEVVAEWFEIQSVVLMDAGSNSGWVREQFDDLNSVKAGLTDLPQDPATCCKEHPN